MRRFFLKAVMVICAVFFVVYCYVQVRTVFESSITTHTADLHTVEHKTEAECYIVRDEVVVTSEHTGAFNYRVDDGEKLSAKQPIADIYSNQNDLLLHEKISKIDERISVLENSSVKKSYLKTITNMLLIFQK